ncbi:MULTISPECIES: hypothetical protein [Trueperella]|uniref:hypothetical protein n=1 Tax=Trueperella TaxID=1069494 RepID=UPI0008A59EEB|nr:MULTISPECIES: hypothetical protein [Trueperella]OFS67507.1 hypothetical protein HMPREF3174_03515 [Trueperella sp. HMSC08H06]
MPDPIAAINLTEAMWVAVIGAAVGVAGLFVTIMKDRHSHELDVVRAAIETYTKLNDRLTAQVRELSTRVEGLESRVATADETVRQLRAYTAVLRQHISDGKPPPPPEMNPPA